MHALKKRALAQCFNLIVRLDQGDEKMLQDLHNSRVVSSASQAFLDGIISFDDFLDIVETVLPSIDAYLEEIKSNFCSFIFNEYR